MRLTNFKNMPHQDQALERSRDEIGFAWFLETGLGKTKLALDNALYLWQTGKINAMLVVAPKGAYRTWTDIEIPKLMDGIDYMAGYWSAGPDTEKSNNDSAVMFALGRALKILVVNTEAFSTKTGWRIAEKFLQMFTCLWVVDESTSIKNPKAIRTKNILSLKDLAAYRRIMTGYPVTRLPQDLYSQVNFLQDKPLGFKSYYAFKSCFQIHRELYVQNRKIQIAVGVQNEDLLNHRLKKISVRYRKEDCLKDLPPKVYEQRLIELTPEQRTMYDQLRKNAFIILGKEPVVTAPMVMTQRMKLHQISCGFLIPDKAVSGDVIKLSSNRLSALEEVIEETDGKVIIWAGYGFLIRELYAALSHRYGAESAATYWGETKDNDRAQIQKNFQDPRHPLRFFIGNPASGKFALTLTAARVVVYYANREDLEARLQSEDRAHRKGQLSSVTYIDILAQKTVDEQIYRNLMDHKTIADRILEVDWRELV